ncbi:MAG: hypothetical protein EHM43_05025 [Ignavibacteriae bacterium]|nr:MAG: hypothetical protein EHM43_05025 [Ignavibacteriota bacterium]
MTNDELLAGFLDRSLNEDQLLEFEARQQQDPAFAHEVNDMLTVEGLLKTSAPSGMAPAGFLVAVESAVALRVASTTSAGAAVGSVFSSTWAWVAGAGLAAIGAAAIYFGVPSANVPGAKVPSAKVPSANVPSATVPSAKVPGAMVPSAKVPGAKVPGANVQISTLANQHTSTPANQHTSTPANQQTNLGVDTEYESTLAKLKKDLEACRASGDHIRCTQIALQIGRTYRERKLSDGAMTYLSMALEEAREARIIQYEVDAYGEIGLLLRDDGKILEGNASFQQAIDLGERHGIDVTRWTRSIR